jgi:hypothetical protein
MPCIVTSTTPTVVNGGVDNVVTITGTGFGPGSTATLEVPNSDLEGRMSIILPATIGRHVLEWTPTSIKINISSLGDPISTSDEQPPFGSGEIKIDPGTTGSQTCTTTIEILHSVDNTLDNGQEKFYGFAFFPIGNVEGKVQVWLDQAFDFDPVFQALQIGTSEIETVLEQVLCDWESAANIDFQYMGIATPGPVNSESRIFVRLGSSSLSTDMKTIYTKTPNCSTVNFANTIRRMRIEIKPRNNWYIGVESGIPNTAIDFQSALVHEFGHLLGNKHSNDLDPNNNQDMIVGQQWTPDSRFMYSNLVRRQVRRSIGSNAIDGANRHIQETKDRLDANLACLSDRRLDTRNDGCGTSSVQSLSESKFSVSFISDYLKIDMEDSMLPAALDVSVYSSNGVLVYTGTKFGNTVIVSAKSWPAGLYAVKVKGSDFLGVKLGFYANN